MATFLHFSIDFVRISCRVQFCLKKLKGQCSFLDFPAAPPRMFVTQVPPSGYILSSLKIEQKMGGCHHLSNCLDNLSRSSNTMEYNRLYFDCPGPLLKLPCTSIISFLTEETDQALHTEFFISYLGQDEHLSRMA